MAYNLPDIRKVDVKGKTVFLRADLDVPLGEGRAIEDDIRLKASVPTIKYLLEQQAEVIVAGHLGRPQKKYQISNIKYQISNEDRKLSLEPVAEWFIKKFKVQPFDIAQGRSSKFKVEEAKLGEFEGWKIKDKLFLLENLRFYEGEEINDEEFSKKLSSLADIYVNDAFAMCHRNHASTIGATRFLPHFAGIHLQEEVEHLEHVLDNPAKPLVVIIGGKKIETKLPLIEKMMRIADFVLVGGKISQEAVAASLGIKLNGNAKLIIAASNEDKTDITKESLARFLEIIKNAKTVIWNGPLGVVCPGPLLPEGSILLDNCPTEGSSKGIVEGIINSKAYSVVGGGDTTEFLRRIGAENKFNFISTGGGAMLSFLAGESLPGLEALTK